MVEFLPTNILDPWHEMETQQMTEAKCHFILSLNSSPLIKDEMENS